MSCVMSSSHHRETHQNDEETGSQVVLQYRYILLVSVSFTLMV